jgi:hypothetical protein
MVIFLKKNIKNTWWRTKSGAAYLITRFNAIKSLLFAILYFDHKCSSFKIQNLLQKLWSGLGMMSE